MTFDPNPIPLLNKSDGGDGATDQREHLLRGTLIQRELPAVHPDHERVAVQQSVFQALRDGRLGLSDR